MGEPARRYKIFNYTTNTTWKQNRVGIIGCNGKPALEVASPPKFKGLPGAGHLRTFLLPRLKHVT